VTDIYEYTATVVFRVAQSEFNPEYHPTDQAVLADFKRSLIEDFAGDPFDVGCEISVRKVEA